ncbi:transposase [Streptomyces sp. TX20-6-3]|nr:transposase [Streptomyces sp. TX20-6-3]MDX2565328.1 transposase [Streptomyces sp. TX20-6-3]
MKIHKSQVYGRPIYVVLAVTAGGHRDILGLWAGGEGSEGARHWLRALL